MSIKAIGNYFYKFFTQKQPKTFKMDNPLKLPVINNSMSRVRKNSKVVVDEVIIGNKRLTMITDYDYSQYPVMTVIKRKQKGFENGKLVFSPGIKRTYLHEEFMNL